MSDITPRVIEELRDEAIEAIGCLMAADTVLASTLNRRARGIDNANDDAATDVVQLGLVAARARLEGLLDHPMRNRLASAVKDRPEPITFGGATRSTHLELVLDVVCRVLLFFDADYAIIYQPPAVAPDSDGAKRKAVAAGLLDEWRRRPRFDSTDWSARIRVECARATDVGAQTFSVAVSEKDFAWEARAAAHLERDPNLTNRQLGKLVGKSHTAVGNSRIIASMKRMQRGEIPRSMGGDPVADVETG